MRKPGTAWRLPTTPESMPNSRLAMETRQQMARHFLLAQREVVDGGGEDESDMTVTDQPI